jgi:alkylresorcinol/alkylpyrone synthase
MTARTYFTSAKFTPHRHNQDHNQDEVARELIEFAVPGFMRFAQTAGVDHGSLALPLSRYPKMTGFTEASNA